MGPPAVRLFRGPHIDTATILFITTSTAVRDQLVSRHVGKYRIYKQVAGRADQDLNSVPDDIRGGAQQQRRSTSTM